MERVFFVGGFDDVSSRRVAGAPRTPGGDAAADPTVGGRLRRSRPEGEHHRYVAGANDAGTDDVAQVGVKLHVAIEQFTAGRKVEQLGPGDIGGTLEEGGGKGEGGLGAANGHGHGCGIQGAEEQR